jgi:hypothetical protein
MGQYISINVQQKVVTFAPTAVKKAARQLAKHNKAAKTQKNSSGHYPNHQPVKPSDKSTSSGKKNHPSGG